MTNKLTFFWQAIVTANELALAFPPRNLPKKFRPDPSTFNLVIVVTDKQTDRQTYAGDSIILAKAFAGILTGCRIRLCNERKVSGRGVCSGCGVTRRRR